MSSRSKKWARSTYSNHKHIKKIPFEKDVTISVLNKLMEDNLGKQCIYCGKTLDFENEEKHRPTLDIINPRKPVSLDNIQIICKQCNNLKKRMSHAKFVMFRQTPEYLRQVRCFSGKYPAKITGRL